MTNDNNHIRLGRQAFLKNGTLLRDAYSVNPENCNHYNRDGLAASPFCPHHRSARDRNY